jgi:hypothetical protein
LENINQTTAARQADPRRTARTLLHRCNVVDLPESDSLSDGESPLPPRMGVRRKLRADKKRGKVKLGKMNSLVAGVDLGIERA